MVHIVTICILISNGPVATTRPFFYCCMIEAHANKNFAAKTTFMPLGVIADLIRNLIRYKDTLPLMRLRVSARNDG